MQVQMPKPCQREGAKTWEEPPVYFQVWIFPTKLTQKKVFNQPGGSSHFVGSLQAQVSVDWAYVSHLYPGLKLITTPKKIEK